jgi:hypothetical protein
MGVPFFGFHSIDPGVTKARDTGRVPVLCDIEGPAALSRRDIITSLGSIVKRVNAA